MRPLRNTNPESYHLITTRTVDGKFFLTPNRKVRKMLSGIIARYQEIFQIELYAYSGVSNHPHFLARAPKGNLDEFMECVNREIARRMNFRLERTGQFWSRRYAAQEVLSEDDLLEAFLYVVTNPVRHGLVPDMRLWTGLNCFKHILSGIDKAYSFRHYSARTEEKKVTIHKLKISPLPMFKDLSPKIRRKKLLVLLERRMAAIREERFKQGLGFLGMEEVLKQSPNDSPRNMSRSPMPPCYTKCPELQREYSEQYRLLRKVYSHASMRFRLGDFNVAFPEHTFKPPLHRKPRLVPFKPLDEEFLKRAG